MCVILTRILIAWHCKRSSDVVRLYYVVNIVWSWIRISNVLALRERLKKTGSKYQRSQLAYDHHLRSGFSKGKTTVVRPYILRTPILKSDRTPVENADILNLSFLTFISTQVRWIFEFNFRKYLQRNTIL